MPGRVLAIDYGQRRIGLAISDPLGITAQRLKTIVQRGNRFPLEELEEVVYRWGVEKIVVGLPLHMDGRKGRKALEAEALIQKLREHFDLPVIAWDERLSTVAAQKALHEMRKKTRRDGTVDAIAAQMVLQAYLDHQGPKETEEREP